MFDKILIKLGLKYDFSEWDSGKFPLGLPPKSIHVWNDAVWESMDLTRTIVLSPKAAHLLSGEKQWPVKDYRIDENLQSGPTGKYLKPSALRLRKILTSRGAL